jgi:hypothetical protein
MTELFGKITRALVDCDSLFITVLNREQEIVWFNEPMAREFGNLSEFRGRKCYEAFAGSAKPHPGCAVQTAFRTGHSERAVELLGGKPHLVLAIPMGDDHVVEVIIEVPGKEHTR